jgi:hypothetical protein
MNMKALLGGIWMPGILATILGWPRCSCANPEQIAARQDAVCQSYGAKPGTPEYTDCRLRLVEMQNRNDIERRRALSQGVADVPNCANLPPAQAFACGAAGAGRR